MVSADEEQEQELAGVEHVVDARDLAQVEGPADVLVEDAEEEEQSQEEEEEEGDLCRRAASRSRPAARACRWPACGSWGPPHAFCRDVSGRRRAASGG